jgi:hypothetical protein
LITLLKNRYSIILYELLKDYINSSFGFPKITIEKFRNLMGIDDNKYKRFYNLKKKVLNIAVDEINKKTDIKCEYNLFIEHGSKYSHIQFHVEENKSYKEKELDLNISDKKLLLDNDLLFETKEKLEEKTIDISDNEKLSNICKEFGIIKDLMFKWIKNYNEDKIMLSYEYTKMKKPKNPGGYMKKIVESDIDIESFKNIIIENKKGRLKAEANNCMMKRVVEQKHCGKHLEDAMDPSDKCYYCCFKNNGSLKHRDISKEKILNEKNV